MSESQSVSVPKWPFFLGDLALLATAGLIFFQNPLPVSQWEMLAGCLCVACGAALAVWPFVLDQQSAVKRFEVGTLAGATEKLQQLDVVAGQISAATNDWRNVQIQSEKITGTANEIAERLTREARAFTEVFQKNSDGDKATLRLEVEKLKRGEAEWLQVVVHTLDHVHALHTGAVRSGQPRLIEQITQFQQACHDTARRVGLAPFGVDVGAPFDAQRHQTLNNEKPASGTVTEMLATGYTFQGRLLRPALVRLGEHGPAVKEDKTITGTEPAQLSLEQPPAE